MLFWYEGRTKKAKILGRFADEAQNALINKEAELRRTTVTGTLPEVVVPESGTSTDRDYYRAVEQYLSEVKSAKSRKTHLAYSGQWLQRNAQQRLGLNVRQMARYWSRDGRTEIDLIAELDYADVLLDRFCKESRNCTWQLMPPKRSVGLSWGLELHFRSSLATTVGTPPAAAAG